MLRLRLYQGNKSTQNYLNKKSKKGYVLEKIVSFSLFVPLRTDIFYFEKADSFQRIYQIDSRKVTADELDEYKQIFLDDGWKYFAKNYVNDNFIVDNIFYSDDPSKQTIFSDEESEKNRNRHNASAGLFKGAVLSMIFLFISTLFPAINSGSSGTFLGFILHNSYVIIAILIMLVSLIKYFRSK